MKKVVKLTESDLVELVKKVIMEQGVSTVSGGPKEREPVTKTFKTTDPEYGKNLKQPEKLVGKRATFYLNAEDAKMAYQAGKSNPQSEGSIIATIGNINSVDQRTVSFSITIDSHQSNYSITTRDANMYFTRTNGTFTIGNGKLAGTYYSESVKNILNDEFFSTVLASNNKQQQTNMV